MPMTCVRDLSASQRQVFDACHNGWVVGGEYRALLGDHERRFWADSPRLLFGEVDRWLSGHARRRAEERLLVKCARPA